jgi:hypothetical protein
LREKRGAINAMTLLDAPSYDPAKARTRKNILIASLIAFLVLAAGVWYFWNLPQEHRVNQFFAAIEANDMPKAFAIWNHDPDWQRHPQQYAQYPYGRFEVDWGHSSDWGDIKTHKIVMSKTVGSGVVVGVEVNGQKTPVFLWVQRSNKTLGFSPVQLSTD